MTDQKHTKELEKINDNRGLNPMEAYLLIYNLCSTVIKDLADLRRQRDEFGDALEKIVLKTEEKNRNAEMLIGEIRYFASNVLTKTKGGV